jgi:predicted AlkP superfamily phosphohydrolase/phosphomutase
VLAAGGAAIAAAAWGVDPSTGDPRCPTSLAYIGPGAGIALLGSFFAVFTALLSGVVFALSWPFRLVWRTVRGRRSVRRAHTGRVVVLGLDGLEPTLTERLMDEGRLPNLARLRAQGTYGRLATTWPPLSPVAWASFSTGTNPGKHNIFDFISRNPRSYRPLQSSVRVRNARRTLRIGGLVIPLGRPEITGLRRSKPFWAVLGEQGVFGAVLRVPITFPPDRFRGVQLSAMCAPDLRGTHGTFTYYTEADEGGEAGAAPGDTGGQVIRVERRNGVVRSYLPGPANALRAGRPELRVAFRVLRARGGAARLEIGGQRIALEPGRASDWVEVAYRALPGVRVRGVCRFLLKRLEPSFEMYCTPVQIDPRRPVMPISHPPGYCGYLARQTGTFATLGLAEDTWALSQGRLDEEAFLAQAYDIDEERRRMFFDALRRVRRGLVVCVFDGPDRIQHMFWRFIDERHPARRGGPDGSVHARVIPEMYRRMDELVGRTLDAIDRGAVLLVISDHGFKSFRRCVDVNRWLLENGYLALKRSSGAPRQYLADVDWGRTRAYGLGLAGIFLNLRGRERQGIVAPGDAAALGREICRCLTGLRDPQTGETAIREATPREAVYSGPYLDAAPDVVIGYGEGYRVSWESVVGSCGGAVFSDNRKAWSGDHCFHPELVPGVLFCNRPLRTEGAGIVDIAPTVLELLGVDRPAYMDGRSLVRDVDRSAPEPIGAVAAL